MVVLRATRKVLRLLPESATIPQGSDTALGDWYVDRVVVGRQPLLLLVSSTSLLSVLTPSRDVRGLPDRLEVLIATRLQRLGIPAPLIEAEVTAMDPVLVAKTSDRSVIGSLIEFRGTIPFYVPAEGWRDELTPLIESRLAEIPCRVTRRMEDTIYPRDDAFELLQAKWG